MRINRKRSTAAAVAVSLLLAGTCSFSAQANVLDDIGSAVSGAGEKIGKFLNDIGVGPVLKSGYDAVVDFVFTYQTQPDDSEMEALARSWAITTWLADKDKEDSNIYYFDNHSLTMVEDPTQIGGGYNVSKTPEGSYLDGKKTGILKAVVTDPTIYSVEWVNYDDELNMYLLQKMKEKKDAETETQSEEQSETQLQSETAAQSETQLQSETVAQSDAAVQNETAVQSDAAAAVQNETAAPVDAAAQNETAVPGDAAVQNDTTVPVDAAAQNEIPA